MNVFVESLCRLYLARRVSEEKLKELLNNGKITEEEWNLIISGKEESNVHNSVKQ